MRYLVPVTFAIEAPDQENAGMLTEEILMSRSCAAPVEAALHAYVIGPPKPHLPVLRLDVPPLVPVPVDVQASSKPSWVCPACMGTKVGADGRTCRQCGGSGRR